MLQKGSYLKVIDNCGATLVSCIHIYGKKYAKAGDVILVSVKKLRRKRRFSSKVKKGQVCKGLITLTKFLVSKKNSFRVNTPINTIILLDNSLRPLGTRIFGKVSFSIRKSKHARIAMLSKGFIH